MNIARFTKREEHEIGLYFRISIIIKGLISLAEIAAGASVLFVPVSSFTDFVIRLAQGELIEEPGNFIATHAVTYANQLAIASTSFIALYLLSRGLIKLVLVVALLRNKLWAYPSSLIALGGLMMYQTYQIFTGFSGFIVALTIFDLLVMWLIWEEYKVLKSHYKNTN